MDVSDIFYFFSARGRGRGVRGDREGGGGRFLLKKSQEGGGGLQGGWGGEGAGRVPDGPNTVSGSTVSDTELSEFFWAH